MGCTQKVRMVKCTPHHPIINVHTEFNELIWLI
nr:MAG TPA: hypothetical protein [Caudoviricetes sp.]